MKNIFENIHEYLIPKDFLQNPIVTVLFPKIKQSDITWESFVQ